MKKFLLKLDLQLFAEDEIVDDIEVDEVDEVDDNGLSGDDELMKAIQSLQSDDDDPEDEEFDDESDDEELDDEEVDEDEDEDDENEDDEEELEDEPDEPVKKKQSKEENSKFAAKRREEELNQKVQAELERLKQESPEFLLAKQLSEQFGKSPQEIIEEMQEAALVRESEETKIPVDVLRKQREAETKSERLEQEINKLKFQTWQSQIKVDGDRIIAKYPMLNYEELDEAVDYILTKARNVDMPLEDAVFAVHGKKIVEELANSKIQDDLANQSGRKRKTPLAPNNGSKQESKTLTAEERYMAKQFGMSESEYNKYKS